MNPRLPFYRTTYSDPNDTNFGIPIFWHYDKAELASKEEFTGIYQKIDDALKIVDKKYHILSLSVYGDFAHLGDVEGLFSGWPCTVMAKHIPKRYPFCTDEICDGAKPRKTKEPDPTSLMAVAEDIHLFIQSNDPPRNICLISSDPDFAFLIQELATAGYTVLLASYHDAEPSLGRYAYFKWHWHLMRGGNGPLNHFPDPVYFK
ncbi:unnamed protein product [Microthlaspi erraticum]|uniref:Uncharacterized protein n=1 Tax=Microthlaspi erraticum TaxID=1685480 RepID=A0A6D2KY05_9BRAS|nr:unnamed protein product [Microthlaspi erraticum]CAA7057041.1 unnamed protein product [Microthlaspi erraticum]